MPLLFLSSDAAASAASVASAVTRLVNEEQLAWSSLDEEKKEASFMMAVAKVR